MRADFGEGAWLTSRRAVAGYVALVLAALLACDLLYIARGEYRDVKFDDVIYYGESQAILHKLGEAVRHRTDALDGTDLVKNVYGPTPTIGALVRWTAFRGVGYPAYLAAVQLALGQGIDRARLGNVALHLGSAVLVWRLGVLLGGAGVGLGALTLFALYLPFTYMTSVLLTENLAAFLTLLAVWSGAAFLGNGPRGRLAAAVLPALFGLALIGMGLTRPGLAPLALVMVVVFAGTALWRFSRERARRVLAGAALAVAFAGVPYFAWQHAVTVAFGMERFTFALAGPRMVSPSMAESYDWENGGWPRPAAFTASPGGRLLQPPPVTEAIRAAPLEAVLLRLEKFYRLWKAPATAYYNPLWGPLGPLKALHGAILGAALLGLLLVPPPRGWPLVFLPVAYTAALYTAYFSDEQRFILPVMGLVIVLAARAAADAWGRMGDPARAPRHLAPDFAWFAGLVLSGAYLAADGFALLPALDPRWMHVAAALLFTACLAAGTWRVGRLLWGGRGVPWGPARLGAAVAVLALPVGAHVLHYADWYSWRTPLRDPGQRVVQGFVLPPGLDWGRVAVATLQIDARDADGMLDNLEVLVNGRPQGSLIPGRLLPASYRHVEEELAPLVRGVDWTRVDVAPGLPQWLLYRLNPARLAGADRVTVSLRLKRPARSDEEVIEIGGELPGPDPDVQLGPRPWLLPPDARRLAMVPFRGRASYWRYQTYGDMRIHGGTRLVGTRVSAYVPKDGAEPVMGPDGDLSPAPFRQTGGYRIRLQLITTNGAELFL
jgi:hypothetical protein